MLLVTIERTKVALAPREPGRYDKAGSIPFPNEALWIIYLFVCRFVCLLQVTYIIVILLFILILFNTALSHDWSSSLFFSNFHSTSLLGVCELLQN